MLRKIRVVTIAAALTGLALAGLSGGTSIAPSCSRLQPVAADCPQQTAGGWTIWPGPGLTTQ